MNIAVTDCGNEKKQHLYLEWLRSWDPAAVLDTVSYREGPPDLSRYDGLVLTGGEDVDPQLSGAAPAELVEETDRRRDEFEFGLLHQAQEHSLPVLGICRGLQVANVFFGGTLVADLPAAGYRQHTSQRGGPELRHRISVREGTMLRAIAGGIDGEVNSYHHQSVLKPGNDLIVSALSPDDVVEAMERKEPEGHPFLLLVQWHPERMQDRKNPMAGTLAQAFFRAVEGSKY